MDEAQKRFFGCCLALLSSFTFAVQGLCFKLIHSVYSMETLFVRMVVSVLLLAPFLFVSGHRVLGGDGDLKWLTLAGASSAFGIAFHYSAMRLMPYADVSAIIFSCFILIIFFAWIFLDESCGVFEIAMTFTTSIGIVLVAHPEALVALFTGGEGHSAQTYDLFISRLAGTGLSLLSCACSTGLFLAAKKVCHVHFSVTTFHSAVWGTMTSALITSLFGEWTSPNSYREWGLLFGVAACGLFSVLFVFQALNYEEAGTVSMVRTSEIAFSYVLQIIFINQYPNVYAAIGAVIISITSVSCGFRAWLRARRKKPDYDQVQGRTFEMKAKAEVGETRDDDGDQSDCDEVENGGPSRKCRTFCCK